MFKDQIKILNDQEDVFQLESEELQEKLLEVNKNLALTKRATRGLEKLQEQLYGKPDEQADLPNE